jgi:hypothetical protein
MEREREERREVKPERPREPVRRESDGGELVIERPPKAEPAPRGKTIRHG